MSFDIKQDTITVGDVTYDVERGSIPMGERLIIATEEGEPTFDGLEAKLESEQYIESWMNPRADVDGILGVMAASHRNYELGGGKNDIEVPDNFLIQCKRCDGSGDDPERYELLRKMMFGSEPVAAGTESSMQSELELREKNDPDNEYEVHAAYCTACKGECEKEVSPIEWAKHEHGARVVLALDFYEHSGITMRARDFDSRAIYPFNCQFDAGVIGIVFDTRETREECGWEDKTDAEIRDELVKEIGIYASYLEGDVVGYTVEDEETNFHESCGGYVGDQDGCATECFAALEQAVIKRLAEIDERAEMAARDIITVA